MVPLYTEDGELFEKVDGVFRDLLEAWLFDEDLTDVPLHSCRERVYYILWLNSLLLMLKIVDNMIMIVGVKKNVLLGIIRM